jgi:hypothetical protein
MRGRRTNLGVKLLTRAGQETSRKRRSQPAQSNCSRVERTSEKRSGRLCAWRKCYKNAGGSEWRTLIVDTDMRCRRAVRSCSSRCTLLQRTCKYRVT